MYETVEVYNRNSYIYTDVSLCLQKEISVINCINAVRGVTFINTKRTDRELYTLQKSFGNKGNILITAF